MFSCQAPVKFFLFVTGIISEMNFLLQVFITYHTWKLFFSHQVVIFARSISLYLFAFRILVLLFSISVIDASFKINPGILTGNVNWMGNYRECMQKDGLHYYTMANLVLNIGQNVVSA